MKFLWLLLILTFGPASMAQSSDEGDAMLDRIAEELLTTAEEDVSYEELYETLSHLLANPVDINSVTREQLRAVMILTEAEINALLRYRDTDGPLLDVLELQAVPGWTTGTVRRVLPFVMVRDPNASVGKGLIRRIQKETRQYVVMRYERTLEDRRGFSENPGYAGNPDRYYLRYRSVRTQDFSLGFTAEKDAGEDFRWSPATGEYGFDFLSGHIQLMKKGRVENLILGDFQCQFGQGLQFGGVFGLGKTAQTVTGIRRSNLGFLPYVSAAESFYLRGIATTIRVSGPLVLHTFGSQKWADAYVEPGVSTVTSLQSSGLHRTPREIASRGQVRDRDLGLILQYRKSQVDVGVIFHQKDLSHSLSPEGNTYNQFRFTGHGFANAGGYFNFSWSGVTLFTEFAHTVGHGRVFTAGLMGNLTGKLEMAWLYRDFSADYYSAYSNPLSESSVPQNEQGLYWGMKYTFSRKVVWSGYLDYFRFPWLRYRIYRPSDGTEWLARIDYTPSRNLSFFVQFREETKARNVQRDGNLYAVLPGTRANLWLNGDLDLPHGLSLRARLQGSTFDLDGKISRGMTLVQEATWKRNRWSVTVRYALFDTDDYDNRQYVYEKDVWLATSLPAYEGEGIRNYVLVHFALSRQVDLWLRWSRTWYSDRTTIGSGGETIDGNARNDVKFQVRIRP